MDLKQWNNYFELFELPLTFTQDLSQLSEHYLQLQKICHPDRFAGASAEEQRKAVDLAATVNDAYQTLKLPHHRARYLLQLRGMEIDDTDTQMDLHFLMQQMELRTELEAVTEKDDPFSALEEIRSELDKGLLEQQQGLVVDLDQSENLSNARERVRKMQFLNKLQQEIEDLETQLAEAI